MKMVRTKHLILALSGPFVVYSILGGLLGRVLAKDSAYRYLSVFQDVVTLILNNYVDPVEVDSVMEGAIRGMMEALDPDSCYLSPEEFRAYQDRGEKDLPGIGIEVTKGYYLQVVAVLPGSAGERAGLRPGDMLKSVDGRNTRDVNVIVGESLLRGHPGSTVALQVVRGRQPEPIELSVKREIYASAPVAYKMLTEDTGYIHVSSLRRGTADEVARSVERLRREKASRLVLDLRNSFGRRAEEGARVAELFVSGGLAAKLERRNGDKSALELSADRVIFRGPLAVLVNHASSGAAEILAAAIAHAGRAEVVGETTSGRAALQRTIPLGDGSGLVLSVSQYWSPDEKPLLGSGMEPSVKVREPRREEDRRGDPILEKALELLASDEGQSKVAA